MCFQTFSGKINHSEEIIFNHFLAGAIMKKTVLALSVLSIIAGSAFAASGNTTPTATNTNAKVAKSNTTTHAASNSQAVQSSQSTPSTPSTKVTLFAQPNTNSRALGQVNVTQQLIPFYHKKGWLKVGNPRNGQVGWVNRAQYQQAVHARANQRTQTVYVEQSQNGDQAPTIVAYRNGKRVTGEEAKALVAQVQRQQHRLNAQMRRYQQQMSQWFADDFDADFDALGFPAVSSWSSGPMLQPIVIIERNNPTPSSHGTANTTANASNSPSTSPTSVNSSASHSSNEANASSASAKPVSASTKDNNQTQQLAQSNAAND